MKKLEEAISKEIAMRSPFSEREIYLVWLSCKSFDLIIAAVDYCASNGFGQLSFAIAHLTQRAADATRR